MIKRLSWLQMEVNLYSSKHEKELIFFGKFVLDNFFTKQKLTFLK